MYLWRGTYRKAFIMIYRHTAKIRICDRFPIDMLRWDACFPADGEAGRLIRELIDEGPDRSGDIPIIKIAAYRETKDPPWTKERWASFMCYIVEEEVGG
jgi:hypothetical protein